LTIAIFLQVIAGLSTLQPITKHARRQVRCYVPTAAKNLNLAALHHPDSTISHHWENRSPCRSPNNARDVTRTNRAIRLAATEQSSDSGFDATVRCGAVRWKPPRVSTFTQGHLGVIHAAAAASDLALGLAIPHRPTTGHQLVDQLLAEVPGNAGISGPPASTIDDDESGLRRRHVLY